MGAKLRAAVYKTHLQVLHLKLRNSSCERVKHVHQQRRTLSLTRLQCRCSTAHNCWHIWAPEQGETSLPLSMKLMKCCILSKSRGEIVFISRCHVSASQTLNTLKVSQSHKYHQLLWLRVMSVLDNLSTVGTLCGKPLCFVATQPLVRSVSPTDSAENRSFRTILAHLIWKAFEQLLLQQSNLFVTAESGAVSKI